MATERKGKGFERVTREHVDQACAEMVAAASAGGGSYFVEYRNQLLPAKRVLREAYRIANGSDVSAKSFSGGLYTMRILERLGVRVVVRNA